MAVAKMGQMSKLNGVPPLCALADTIFMLIASV